MFVVKGLVKGVGVCYYKNKMKNWRNKEIAGILSQIAGLLELEGRASLFEIRAYQNAARQIDYLDRPVSEIYQEKGLRGLQEIEGIGKTIAHHLEEFLTTGKISNLEKLTAKIPTTEYQLSQIPSIGAKTAQKLYRRLRPKSLDDFQKKIYLAQQGATSLGQKIRQQLAVIKIKEKTINNILRGLAIKKDLLTHRRAFLFEAENLTQQIIQRLTSYPEVKKAEPVGSLRRRQGTIGDIDLAVISNQPAVTVKKFTKEDFVAEVLINGQTKGSVITHDGLRVDIEISDQQRHWGSLLVHFTGNKDFNIAMREYALTKGLSFSEYGFKKIQNPCLAGRRAKSKIQNCPKEIDVFKGLKLQYIPPELRENRGELAAAINHQLPRLLTIKDIHGDLHTHSNYSDGEMSVVEFAGWLRRSPYQYLVIGDHGPGLGVTSEVKIADFQRRHQEIDQANRRLSHQRLLKGVEVNIRIDGSLDLPNDFLAEFDVVVASIHSSLNAAKEKNTRRLLAACHHPLVDIIGHPSGRLINQRPAAEIDWPKVFQAASQTKTVLEINSFPDRLDLPDYLCLAAKKMGVKFAINTDTHRKGHLDFLQYGLDVARRGWLEKDDIINTKKLQDLLTWLKKS